MPSSDAPPPSSPRGRGAGFNPHQRFTALHIDYDEGENPGPGRTQYLVDHSSSIIARHDSPDLPFEASLNPYRGCEHGCAYCYARPTHEYLGFSPGLDFESRIMVKPEAAKLLRVELARTSYKPVTLSLSGVTDPYQPVEKKLRITRACLEVLAECRNPVAIVTKNHLVARDADLLAELARYGAAAVYVSVTSLDPDLARILEPRASAPAMRLQAIRALREAGVPVGVSVAPVIPAINDEEIPAILKAAAEAGATFSGSTIVRLPFAVKDIFTDWLQRHFPQRVEKVLGRIREMQGPTLSHGEFGKRLRGEGIWAEQIRRLYTVSQKRVGIAPHGPDLSTAHFRRPRLDTAQMELGLE